VKHPLPAVRPCAHFGLALQLPSGLTDTCYPYVILPPCHAYIAFELLAVILLSLSHQNGQGPLLPISICSLPPTFCRSSILNIHFSSPDIFFSCSGVAVWFSCRTGRANIYTRLSTPYERFGRARSDLSRFMKGFLGVAIHT